MDFTSILVPQGQWTYVYMTSDFYSQEAVVHEVSHNISPTPPLLAWGIPCHSM